jgi:KUP system potassium uptake protein
MFVTFFDTCMVSLATIFVWRISPFIVFLPWLIIACLDGTFLSSALTKVPEGAWFTIALSAVLAFVFLLWRYGKEQQWFAEAEDRYPTSHFVVKTDPTDPCPSTQTQYQTQAQMCLTERYGSTPVSTARGLGIFFDKAGETTPIVFSQFLLKLTAMPEVIVFLHLRPLEMPSVAPDQQYTVSRLAIPHCYRLVVRYGFNDEIITPNLSSVIVEQVKRFLTQQEREIALPPSSPESEATSSTSPKNEKINNSAASPGNPITEELTKLDHAYAHKMLYIVGKEQMKIKAGTNYARWTLLNIFLWIRENTRTKMANLKVPIDRVVEVGFLKEI